MMEQELSGSVNLLPLFDAYTFGFGRHLEPILNGTQEQAVFRPQGWISPVVLVDGCVAGTWKHARRRSDTLVSVRMFNRTGAPVKRRIEEEVRRMGAFLDSGITLEYEQPGTSPGGG